MSIFKKFTKLVSSQLNALLDAAENPEKMHAQEKLDLEAKKKQARNLIIKTQTQLNLTQKKSQEVKNLHEKLQAKYQELAPNHEQQKIIQDQISTLTSTQDYLQEKLDIHKKTLNTLKSGEKNLDKYINNLNTKHQKNIIKNTDSFDNFDRMEKKIELQEFELEALEELLEEEKKSSRSNESKALDKFSDPSSLDNELERIRKKLSDNNS